MRTRRVWARLLGLGAAVVEDVKASSEGEVVVAVRPRWSEPGFTIPVVRFCPAGDEE